MAVSRNLKAREARTTERGRGPAPVVVEVQPATAADREAVLDLVDRRDLPAALAMAIRDAPWVLQRRNALALTLLAVQCDALSPAPRPPGALLDGSEPAPSRHDPRVVRELSPQVTAGMADLGLTPMAQFRMGLKLVERPDAPPAPAPGRLASR